MTGLFFLTGLFLAIGTPILLLFRGDFGAFVLSLIVFPLLFKLFFGGKK